MGTHANDALTFLVQTLFGLYMLIVMLRFLFQLVRADFYNPVSQFIVKATNPPVVQLRRLIPGVAGIDVSCVVLLVVLQAAELWVIYGLKGFSLPFMSLGLFSLAELFRLTINVFFWSILIQVIISWVNPGSYNPVTSLLYSLNEPLLRPARRLVPPISGFDLSPVVVMIALKLVEILFIRTIEDMAKMFL
jgi:YggT family protein